jgi:hypothetical protein
MLYILFYLQMFYYLRLKSWTELTDWTLLLAMPASGGILLLIAV